MLLDTKHGCDALNTTLRIVQQAVFDMGNSGHPDWRRWDDGMHLIGLGRGDQDGWRPVYLWWCTPGYRELRSVADLRNAVCHPEAEIFQNPWRVDALLKKAHEFVVAIDDRNAALQVMQQRDAVRDEANQSLRIWETLCDLSVLPYCEELVLDNLHTKLARNIGILGCEIDNRNWRTYALAKVWATQTGEDVKFQEDLASPW
ncbi:hypothetical protein F4777DRAFT_557862 [Nemania sp. FL0916]|nr:hypothetical protein F4777DRAFT_557862 [Nemania sp. FL0916]